MRAMLGSDASRARRRRRRGRAERVPHQALHLVGRRVARLDRREHADDRLHRGRHRCNGRPDRRRRDDDVPADRRRRLGVPRHPLRVPDGDGGVGALGGDDRVHVHGAAVARHAPGRAGGLRDLLRADPGGAPVRHLRLRLLRSQRARRQLRRGLRHPRHLVDLVHRHRDDGVRPAAHLTREGDAARVRRTGNAARRLGRLLPRVGPPGVDAVAREAVACDVCARRDPCRHHGGGRARLDVGRNLADAHHRRRVDPTRPLDLPSRRACTRRGTGS